MIHLLSHKLRSQYVDDIFMLNNILSETATLIILVGCWRVGGLVIDLHLEIIMFKLNFL